MRSSQTRAFFLAVDSVFSPFLRLEKRGSHNPSLLSGHLLHREMRMKRSFESGSQQIEGAQFPSALPMGADGILAGISVPLHPPLAGTETEA